MQVWQKGPFRICVDHGDDDPALPSEYEIALRVNPAELAGVVLGAKVSNAEQAFEALHKIEENIAQHLGKLAPEIRDTIRNEAAKLVPGLPKALGWQIEKKKA